MSGSIQSKELLFSVTRDDCDWAEFRGSGPGGQHRNKVATAIRVVHRASGAIGQASDDRSQLTNRREAFRRMAETKEFKAWLRFETARRLGSNMLRFDNSKWSLDQVIAAMKDEANLKFEIRDFAGRWMEVGE